MKRTGIIDIGTNTFNLLIIEFGQDKSHKIVHEEKLPVKLGKGSMKDGVLKDDAIQRALVAIGKHIETSKKYGAKKVEAFATSAVRNAKNKEYFINEVKIRTGLHVNVISGDKEAFYIYLGVKQAVKMLPGIVYLILDIGGGSNEFIICDHENIHWRKSYDLGMARLLEIISPSNPISENEIEEIIAHTESLIHDLAEQCDIYRPSVLIGASGSFETYLSMILMEQTGSDNILQKNTELEIQIDDFNRLYERLIFSTAEERIKMPGLPDWRVDMIVLAIIFTKFVLKKFELQQIIYSGYALKEGVMHEFTNILTK